MKAVHHMLGKAPIGCDLAPKDIDKRRGTTLVLTGQNIVAGGS